MGSKLSKTEVSIYADLEAEFAEVESDFGPLGDDDQDDPVSSELQDFEAALVGTEFALDSAEAAETAEIDAFQIADGVQSGGDEEGWLGDVWRKVRRPVVNQARRKAEKIIAQLTALVRKYAKYRSCIPAVTKAVVAFKAARYGSALQLGYAAFVCIRSKG